MNNQYCFFAKNTNWSKFGIQSKSTPLIYYSYWNMFLVINMAERTDTTENNFRDPIHLLFRHREYLLEIALQTYGKFSGNKKFWQRALKLTVR